MVIQKYSLCGLILFSLVAAIFPFSRSVHGQSSPALPCGEFQELVNKTYDFKPSKLTEAEQTVKSGAMDVVWDKVKSDSQKYLPCLKSALKSPTANRFFLFDGSMLLLSVDQSMDSKNLLISSFAKADLEDIALQNWIAPILMFGLEGLDTSAAGEAWLKAKDPNYYLPQHGDLPVDRRIGALAIFGSMDEKFATPALARLAAQNDKELSEIAVRILLDQGTLESRRLIRGLERNGFSIETVDRMKTVDSKPSLISPRSGKPLVSRQEFINAFEKMAIGDASEFTALTVRVSDGERDAIVVLNKEDLPLIRKARRFMASTGTPHVPEWYKSFTDIILTLSWEPSAK